jgi:hypothetical protein
VECRDRELPDDPGGALLTTIGPVGTVLVLAAGRLATAIAATASPAVRHADG